MLWFVVLGIIYLAIGTVMVFYDCSKPVQDRKGYTYKKHLIIFYTLFWPRLIYLEVDYQCYALKNRTGYTLTILKKLKLYLYQSIIQILVPMVYLVGYIKGRYFSSNER